LLQISKSTPLNEGQLGKVAGLYRKKNEEETHAGGQTSEQFNLEEFLDYHAIQYTLDKHDGRDRFRLAHCPFNPEHVSGESAIFRSSDGQNGFKCFHNSCSDKRWRDVLRLFEGRQASQDSSTFGGPSTAYQDWPTPTPLPDALPPVEPFTADLLPSALRDWVVDISHRMQCPPDFPAVAAMVALSSVIGARAVIQPKEKDDQPPAAAPRINVPTQGDFDFVGVSFSVKPMETVQDQSARTSSNERRERWEASTPNKSSATV
jgi:hypothetical protein